MPVAMYRPDVFDGQLAIGIPSLVDGLPYGVTPRGAAEILEVSRSYVRKVSVPAGSMKS
jgi:hypothetical protein